MQLRTALLTNMLLWAVKFIHEVLYGETTEMVFFLVVFVLCLLLYVLLPKIIVHSTESNL